MEITWKQRERIDFIWKRYHRGETMWVEQTTAYSPFTQKHGEPVLRVSFEDSAEVFALDAEGRTIY